MGLLLVRGPGTVDAIGTYDGVFGLEATIALALCERHTDALRHEVLVLATD